MTSALSRRSPVPGCSRSRAPARGGQLKAGARVAKGDWFLFLHSDTKLGRDWPMAVKAHLLNPDAAGLLPASL